MKRISIIIVTYNSEKDIFDCVRSIQKFADIPLSDIELIVVDNNSREPDKMFQELRNIWREDIVLIKNSRNGGYGQGNNVGIRSASAPVILIMNPDVRLASPFFKKPLTAFAKDKALIMYGAKQWYTPTMPSQSSFCCTQMLNGYLRSLVEALSNRVECYIPSLMYFSGSCFYVSKSKFEEIGLFDEDFFMYGEENDMHYKFVRKFGAHFSYDKSLKYLHLTSERPPSVDYELKLADVAIRRNLKRGVNECITIERLIQWYRMRFWREWLKKKLGKPHPHYTMLKDLLQKLSTMKSKK